MMSRDKITMVANSELGKEGRRGLAVSVISRDKLMERFWRSPELEWR